MPLQFPNPEDISPHLAGWKWRGQQDSLFDKTILAPTQHLALCLPTGTGKSLFAAALAEILCPDGGREQGLVLTSTKALQDQYNRDFPHIPDFRGRSNYSCLDNENAPPWWRGSWTCEEGQEAGGCNHTRTDVMLGGGQMDMMGKKVLPCPHLLALLRIRGDRIGVTNYAAGLSYGLHLGRDLVVLDEAHDAVDQVCSSVSGTVYLEDAKAVLADYPPPQPPDHVVVAPWIDWATRWFAHVEAMKEGVGPGMLRRRVSRLAHALANISALDSRESAIEHNVGSGGAYTTISPIWPRGRLKFAPKTVWMSATLTPGTLGYFGIGTKEATYITAKSPFPIKNQPVYLVKSGVRVNKDSSDGDLVALVDCIDKLLRARLDRKGIIVTTSYSYQRIVRELSDHKGLMYCPDRENTGAVVEAFRAAPAPAILISPAITTGWDFPGDQCSYIIVPKVPIPDTRSPLMNRRCHEDKGYRNYLTMQTLMQVAGRGNRILSDKCEVLIVDDSIRWFWPNNSKLAAPWFRDRIIWCDDLPDPIIL